VRAEREVTRNNYLIRRRQGDITMEQKERKTKRQGVGQNKELENRHEIGKGGNFARRETRYR